MQKISKREKKFEKKLDAKLEKLESKTKKIMEKKSLLGDGQLCNVLGSRDVKRRVRMMVATANAPLTTPTEQVMDALPVDEYNYVPHVMKGEIVNQVWKVINSGHMPWTEDTELRFAWGSKSLVPLTTTVKCPLLRPGETGKVKVKLQAPSKLHFDSQIINHLLNNVLCIINKCFVFVVFPGNFESYWHFHHDGRRFGHWLGCAVIVDSEQPPAEPRDSCTVPHTEPQSTAVDLTMKCNKYISPTTDDMKMFNEKTEKESVQKDCDIETGMSQKQVNFLKGCY